jgi:hypothetical protein
MVLDRGGPMDWKSAEADDKGTNIPSKWLFLHYYEALNVLFRIENALRILVYVVLKNDKRDKWLDISVSSDEADKTTISALAKKRIAQHQMFGYLGYPIDAPMMHLTSGELVRLITSDTCWPLFKDFFLASRQVVTLKLQEVGDVRNALAHFRPVSEGDVEAVKQNSKQVLSAVERALESMIMCDQRVPTNTVEKWYQELRSLGTDLCSFEFNQSTDGRWIRITLRFKVRIIIQQPENPQSFVRYYVLNINSPEVLKHYDELRQLTVYLTERVLSSSMPDNFQPVFIKQLQFTFSRATLTNEYEKVSTNLKNLLADIDNEAELIAEDNLAKGKLIHLIGLVARKQKGEKIVWWNIETEGLRCQVESHHPTEYWGSISLEEANLISDSEDFPWMPTPICPPGLEPF